MKIISSKGIVYFIGMPMDKKLTLRVEGDERYSFISLSDEKGTRMDMILTEQIKREIIKEFKKNAKKETRRKETAVL